MTDLELHDWALLRYGNADLANKLAIVGQLHRDDQTRPEVVAVNFTVARIDRRRRRV